MTTLLYEIVTYTVTDENEADAARDAARERLATFPGFIHWSPFTRVDDARTRVDLVAWRSLEEANSAARMVASAAEFAGFRASVSSCISMQHYRLPSVSQHPVANGSGVEIGRFRLKQGVDEADMRKAHAAMVENHLSRQTGWRRQHLVKLDDGVFLDLAFADARLSAEEICSSWRGQLDCDAFLALIEPQSMEFGTML